ncbi:MAG: hypothetical protein ACK49X_14700, partial [Akkermansiaceae bacterium]
MRFRIILLNFLGIVGLSAFELPEKSTQCVVGISEDWDSSHVTLTYYEKKAGKWQQAGESWKGRLGSKGLVWGRGLHPNPSGAVMKKEGDDRSPAGVFDLGGVWGSHKSVKKHPKTFYHQVTTRDLWVEDPNSKSYNQF